MTTSVVYGQYPVIRSDFGRYNGISYIQEMFEGGSRKTIYRTTNQFTDVSQRNRYTGVERPYDDETRMIAPNMYYQDMIRSDIRDGIGSDLLKQFQAASLNIFVNLKISPDTGRVMELEFRISTSLPELITPQLIYNIEETIKRNRYFPVTEAGKQMNYLLLAVSFVI